MRNILLEKRIWKESMCVRMIHKLSSGLTLLPGKDFHMAQYSLGWMYRNEPGTQLADTQQAMAFNWLDMAAKNGVAKAQYYPGVM